MMQAMQARLQQAQPPQPGASAVGGEDPRLAQLRAMMPAAPAPLAQPAPSPQAAAPTVPDQGQIAMPKQQVKAIHFHPTPEQPPMQWGK